MFFNLYFAKLLGIPNMCTPVPWLPSLDQLMERAQAAKPRKTIGAQEGHKISHLFAF